MGLSAFLNGSSRWKKMVVAAGGLIILYAAFGFFIAPYIFKRQLVAGIGEQLRRNATVEKVKINPFALSVTVAGFNMADLDSEPFVGFEELYVNFQLSSVFRRAFTFGQIRLVGLDSRVRVLEDGRLNFSDLLLASERPAPEPDESGTVPPIIVYQLQIEQGRVLFQDFSKPTPFRAELQPLGLLLENFSTRRDKDSPYAFTADLGRGGTVRWQGELSVNPFRSQGRLEITAVPKRILWEYLQDQVRFEILDGVMNLGGEYIADFSGETPIVKITNGVFRLQHFMLSEKGQKDPLISVPRLLVEGINADLIGTNATIGLVHSKDAKVKGWITPGGTLNFSELFAMNAQQMDAQQIDAREEDVQQKDARKKTQETSPESSDQAESHGGPWLFNIKELTLENYGVLFENRTLEKPVGVDLTPINLTLKNLSNEKDAQAEVSLQLTVNQAGTVALTGPVTVDPISADLVLKVNAFSLIPWQPYIDTVVRLELVSGTVELDGRLKYRALGVDGPEIRYAGAVHVNGFEAFDPQEAEDFLKWKSLVFHDLVFDYLPTKLHIAEIAAHEPYARVIIWPDKTVNISQVFVPAEDPQAILSVAGQAAEAVESEKEAVPITIDQVRVENGSAHFSDFSMKPNFATGIHDLQGTIQSLSSDPSARADVLLKGRVDKYAPVHIAGQVNPLSPEAYVDMALSFKNIELTTFTPYSGRFVGYAVEKGKLSLDLQYKLSENILVGENKVVVNQLTLGDQVDSPDATKLPVRLALALLKDRHGNIDLDLPVRGNLDDPEFSYGQIIVKAVVNLVTKIVTSPFNLLARLVGGDGEEMSFVVFDFGRSTLNADQGEKLDKLAKALLERPALQLEIKAKADIFHDKAALAERILLNQLKRLRFAELVSKGIEHPAEAEAIVLSNEEENRLLIQTYIERFGEHPEALLTTEPEPSANDAESDAVQAAPLPTSDDPDSEKPVLDPQVVADAAKKRLVKEIRVDDISLRRLAQERALGIKGHLVERGVSEERIFILDVQIVDIFDSDGAKVDLGLSG
jgi:hypothetical protein